MAAAYPIPFSFYPESNLMAEGFTQIPNWILDGMATMKASTLQIVLCVCRQTVGYTNGNGGRKEWDRISLSQFAEKTSLSRQGVVNAIGEAIDGGYIQRREKGQCFEYKLVNSVYQSTELTSQLSVPVLVNSVDQLTPKLVNSVDTQKKDIKEKKETIVSSVGGAEKTNGKAPNKDPNFGTVCTAYEQNIGLLTSNIGESIEGLLYEDNIPAEWVVDAIKIACEQEKRNLAYVRGICRRWKREGKTKPQFTNGNKVAPALAVFTGSEK